MGFIYKIEIGEDLYIGSTKEKYLCQRQKRHNHGLNNPNSNDYNIPLYRFCREKKVEKIICELIEEADNNELLLLEQKYINMLKPNLNVRKAFQTKEERLEYQKKNNNKKINCSICNKEMLKTSIYRHINKKHK